MLREMKTEVETRKEERPEFGSLEIRRLYIRCFSKFGGRKVLETMVTVVDCAAGLLLHRL